MSSYKILRVDRVCEITGLPKSTLYHKVKNGEFPKPIKISERSSGFIANEVQEWIEQKIKVSRSHGGK